MTTKNDNPDIKIGSKVRITDKGKIYDAYSVMAEFMQLTGFKFGLSPTDLQATSDEFTIVARANHESQDVVLVGIEHANGQQFIYSSDAVRVTQEPIMRLSDKVAEMEAELKAVTQERDKLKARLEAICNIIEEGV